MQLSVQSGSTYSKVFSWIEFQDVKIKNRKISLVLRILFSFLFLASFVINFFYADYSNIGSYMTTLFLLGMILVFLLTLKYYDWPVMFFFLVVVGLFYKRNHWPFAVELVTLSASVLAVFTWYNAFKFIFTFRNNTFLRWFGSLSQFVIVFFMIGFSFKHQNWAYANIIIGAGSFLFVFSILALVFTLPFSDYVAWSDVDRKVFFRTVLVPLTFIFILFTLFFVFPDVYNSLIGRSFKTFTLNISPVELMKFEGI